MSQKQLSHSTQYAKLLRHPHSAQHCFLSFCTFSHSAYTRFSYLSRTHPIITSSASHRGISAQCSTCRFSSPPSWKSDTSMSCPAA